MSSSSNSNASVAALPPISSVLDDECGDVAFCKALVSILSTLSTVSASENGNQDPIALGKRGAKQRLAAQKTLTALVADCAAQAIEQRKLSAFVRIIRVLQQSPEPSIARQVPRLSFLTLLGLQRAISSASSDVLLEAKDEAVKFLVDVMSAEWEALRVSSSEALETNTEWAMTDWSLLESDLRVAFRMVSVFNVVDLDKIPQVSEFISRMWKKQCLKACCFVMAKIGWKVSLQMSSFTSDQLCHQLLLRGFDDAVVSILKDCCDNPDANVDPDPVVLHVIDQAIELSNKKLATGPTVAKNWSTFAYNLVKLFQLESRYKSIVMKHRQQSISRMIAKDKLAPMVGLIQASNDLEVLEWTVQKLVSSGRSTLAFGLLQQVESHFGYEAVSTISSASEIDINLVSAQLEIEQRDQLQLELPMDSVHFVSRVGNSIDMFVEWTNELCNVSDPRQREIVGLDAEWKPVQKKKTKPVVSILQVANLDQVYILDLIDLFSKRNNADTDDSSRSTVHDEISLKVDMALKQLFECCNVVKLGYEFQRDVKLLKSCYPGLQCWGVIHPLVNLHGPLFSHLLSKLPYVAAEGDESIDMKAGGLKRIVKRALGKSLNKSQQMSNWERRPLTMEQLKYAALDSLSMVLIFEKLGTINSVDHLVEQLTTRQSLKSQNPSDAMPNTSQETTVTVAHVIDAARARCGEEKLQYGTHISHVTTPDECATAVDASKALGCHVSQIVKTLGFFFDAHEALRAGMQGDHQSNCSLHPSSLFDTLRIMHSTKTGSIPRWVPVVVLLRGSDSVDSHKLARMCSRLTLGVHSSADELFYAKTRRCVRMASPKDCVKVFGFIPGTMAPLGVRKFLENDIPVLVDERVARATGFAFTGAGSLVDLLKFDNGSTLVRATRAVECDISTTSLSQEMNTRCNVTTGVLTDEAERATVPSRFIVDHGLGKITKWLRVLGFDAVSKDDFEYMQNLNRSGLIRAILNEAETSGRLLLTSDRKLSGYRTTCSMYVIRSKENSKIQFEEVCARFGIGYNSSTFLTRCTACNTLGFEAVTRDELLTNERLRKGMESVPREVFENHDANTQYWHCRNPDCGKVYWEGNKFFMAHDRFESHFNYGTDQ